MNYFSQYRQDQFLNEGIFSGLKFGTYLEVGAHNGLELSNCAFFDLEQKWSGVCVEPIPSVFEQLVKNRPNAKCIEAAVWTENTTKKFQVIKGYSEMLSGFKDTYDPQHDWRIKNEVAQFNQEVEEISVSCICINDLLFDLTNDGKCGIDLLSIDTEGSESAILKALNYDKYKVRAIIMENNYDDEDIRRFLVSKGYQQVGRLGIDDVYVWEH